ncbi:hypothetical protein FA13DRAFT_1807146 [Coprinellus micaceus]|uniref:Uncharacterized protein n=1 Tax=Coprinellus micaceus TaxID=71717 RepID=A0A4Y7RBY8_COPMI|nr:hypothetical protein FA13DRAFT_1807146 [Coprinellus micaceus]
MSARQGTGTCPICSKLTWLETINCNSPVPHCLCTMVKTYGQGCHICRGAVDRTNAYKGALTEDQWIERYNTYHNQPGSPENPCPHCERGPYVDYKHIVQCSKSKFRSQTWTCPDCKADNIPLASAYQHQCPKSASGSGSGSGGAGSGYGSGSGSGYGGYGSNYAAYGSGYGSGRA